MDSPDYGAKEFAAPKPARGELRDEFAGRAMQALIGCADLVNALGQRHVPEEAAKRAVDSLAVIAYDVADAMLEAREKR